jgi:TolA-binding protein
MKKLTMLLLLGLALGSQVLHAAEKNDDTMSFWEKLRSKIESFTPQRRVTSTNATGGVRGAPESSEDVYWKNEATAKTMAADELEAFKNAMKLTASDDKAPAKTAFSEFIKKYPDSPLRKDADQALVLLQPISAPAK